MVGGYAVALHGYVRYTADMDIWILATKANAKRIIKALTDFNVPKAEELYSIFVAEKKVFGNIDKIIFGVKSGKSLKGRCDYC